MSKVKLYITSGEVFKKSNGKERKISAEIPESLDSIESLAELYGENAVPINHKDIIITKENSYAINIQDSNDPDYTAVSLFPASKVQLSIKDKEITQIDLKKGLVRVETKNPINLPFVNIEHEGNTTQFFYINVQENKVSISLVSGQAEIIHEKLSDKCHIEMKEQVNATPSKLEGPIEVEQKFKDAYKTQWNFEAKFNTLFDDASFLQQKAYIADMGKNISELEKDIEEIEEEGGQAPAQMKIGLKKLKQELKKAKKEFHQYIEEKKSKKKKEKEISEFQKKFEQKEKKFEKELNQMSQEISSEEKTNEDKKELSDLEKKIQKAGKELENKDYIDSEGEDSQEDLSDLEKKIKTAADDLENN
jgi:hypothetical protein